MGEKRLSANTVKKSYQIRSMYANTLYEAAAFASSTNNLVVSPMAVRTCITLAFLGSEGATETEIQKYLYLPNNKQHIAGKVRHQLDSDKIFMMSNNIFISQDIDVRTEYEDMVKLANGGPPKRIDFSKPIEAVTQINRIIEAQTNGKIKNAMTSEEVTGSKIVMVNAIYLKAAFARPFDIGCTEHGKFWVNKSTATSVDMMQTTDKLKYAELPDLQAKVVEIPFTLEKSGMLIFLPDKSASIKDLEQQLRTINYFELCETMEEKEVHVTLPKLVVEFQMNGGSVMPKLGVKEMFLPTANFNGITRGKINVDHLNHIALINLNEAGAEVVVEDFVRNFEFTKDYDHVNFVANRPFIFVIKDGRTVHFIGRIVKM